MTEKLAKPPPATKVLASGDLSPEQVKELAAKAKLDSSVKTPTEDVGIKPKPISELITVGKPEVQPSEVPSPGEEVKTEDVTHDPLKDTQNRMRLEIEKSKGLEDKLAKLETDYRALVSGAVAERGLHTAEPSQKEPPPEFFDPNPTEEETVDPTKYTMRMRNVDAYNREREERTRAITSFVKANPGWKEHQPAMNAISERMPALKYGPDSLSNLLELAKQEKEREDMKKTLKEAEESGFTAGANMEKGKTEVFVKPGAAAPAGVITEPDWNSINPATGKVYTSEDMTQWAKEHNLYRES